ncbi:UNVERIFIED_CONTAM: hypothetical protein Slati_4450400 [Sesamum latifolium]|uniref:Uncharacterized protein n=1 Tax=Sesamum latifolium TaxID=2727402 RepID=A0AAW2SRH3_9LAMI
MAVGRVQGYRNKGTGGEDKETRERKPLAVKRLRESERLKGEMRRMRKLGLGL